MMIVEILKHIMVFKTNIHSEADRCRVGEVLDGHELIEKWNIDLLDIDRVLRVVSRGVQAEEIIALIKACEYECSELPD